MNNQKHNWILYLITTTIIVTVSIQFYWNYKNYEQNKQRVLNEIQISLDNTIETYYSNLSKQTFFAFVETKNGKNKKIRKKITSLKKNKNLNNKDSILLKVTSLSLDINDSDLKKNNSNFVDSILKDVQENFNLNSNESDPKRCYLNTKKRIHTEKHANTSKIKIYNGRKSSDSLKLIKNLSTILISLQNDSINYKEIGSIFTKELKNKGIISHYYFKHFINDTLIFDNSNKQLNTFLKANAKSTYFKQNEKFQLIYSNPTYEALKRSSTGILLSFLLALAVISSLFYLLRIINKQKELAEIKNDLISNITHEFKTPITTVSTAIEAINNFNTIENKERTKKYLSISSVQLKKLYQMVEKLLETAALDSEQLILKKETVNLIDLIEKTTQKHQQITDDKNIKFSTNISEININVDFFHFENVISNLIDNALKYGGDTIEININAILNNLEISITDNGKGIEKNQQEKIFEKFYRVPKGNTHDVKGFGIGLYYSKKIIEKHNGFISLHSNSKQTVFKIIVPND